jgi:hypothetical protein
LAGPISWTLAGSGPPDGTGSASAGTPARLTGAVMPRMCSISWAWFRVGGNLSSVGKASRSTRSHSADTVARHRAASSQAALSCAGVTAAA